MNSIEHNEIAKSHHRDIIKMGYWDTPPHIAILLMLITTEIVKLFDEDKLNNPEKLADTALRLYDFCGYYNIDLSGIPTVQSCTLWDMMRCLTNELEAYRVNIDTNFNFIKQCISMCYLYAEYNNIDLLYEIERKREIMKCMGKKII